MNNYNCMANQFQSQEKGLEQTNDRILIILSVAERILSRQTTIDDPVVRYSLFLEKLALAMDISLAVLDSQLNGLPETTKDKAHKLKNDINEELLSLMSWVRSPVYSPDHPYGNEMKKSAERSFESNI